MQDVTVHAVVFCDVTASSNWVCGRAMQQKLSCPAVTATSQPLP